MWLRDALPHHIIQDDNKPYARVMVYGYQSSLPRSQSIQNLEDLATSFHTDLLGLVSTTASKPIIFIAHSLGGLIVKQVSFCLEDASFFFLFLSICVFLFFLSRRRSHQT